MDTNNFNTVDASSKHFNDLIKELNTDVISGLSYSEVLNRQKIYGLNELSISEKESILSKFLSQFKDPLILLLLGSAIISTCMGHIDDAISITISIIIVVTVAFIQEYRSEKSLQEMKKLVPTTCIVIRQGKKNEITGNELVPGDIILIKMGDRIPADCRLIETNDLHVDEASLTGETLPVEKHTNIINNTTNHSISDKKNLIYMGTLVSSGKGKAIVYATGKRSEFGAVFDVMEKVEDRKTPLQEKMDHLGQQLSIISFSIIGFIIFIGIIQGKDFIKMFQIGVSLAVAAIPEGLPICVTVTLALGVMRMAKKHAVLKKLPAVEALGCTSIICVDKTGTITKNEMTVNEIYIYNQIHPYLVKGIGYSFNGSIIDLNDDNKNNESIDIHSNQHISLYNCLVAGALCNNAEIKENNTLIGAPTEGAIICAAGKMGITVDNIKKDYKRLHEIPFNSDKKWMAVKYQCLLSNNNNKNNLNHFKNYETAWYVKGTVEIIMNFCDKIIDKSGIETKKDKSDDLKIYKYASTMASKGLRVIAIAYGDGKNNFNGNDNDNFLVFAGIVGIVDLPREGVATAISKLSLCGVRTVMITGDSNETAEAVALDIGLVTEGSVGSLSGSEIDKYSIEELKDRVLSVNLFYRTCPRHKLKIIRAFQASGNQVAMTGDGVNDAPALKAADIGIAMGISGTDVSKEASDMILMDDNFSTILCAIEEGKSIFYNIKNFLRFQLSTSIAALILITLTTVFDLPSPLNPMQILWINIIMDGPPAQSLGVEPVDTDVMKNPPRKKDTPMINNTLIKRIITSSSLIVLGTLYVFYNELEYKLNNTTGKYEYIVNKRDRTISFTTFVFFDMFNALSCRSEQKSIFTIGIFSNKAFTYSVGASIIGQLLVIYFKPLQNAFQTTELSFQDLLYVCIISSSVFIIDEIRKYFINHKNIINNSIRKDKKYKNKNKNKYNNNNNKSKIGFFSIKRNNNFKWLPIRESENIV